MFSGWDLTQIADIFLPIDRELIRRIPLSLWPRPDHVLVWHFSSNGSYSVKSGYHFEMKDREAASSSNRLGEAEWWRKLWYTKIPNKVKIHVWRAFHEAFPVRSQLDKRGVSTTLCCPRCSQMVEDVSHSFWLCEGARVVWEKSALWPVLNVFRGGTFSALCLFVANKCSLEDLGVFCMLALSLWTNRICTIVFEGRKNDPVSIVSRAGRLLVDFLTCNGLDEGPVRRVSLPRHAWQPPGAGRT